MSDLTTRSELLQMALLTGGGVAVGGLVIAALPDLAGSKPSAAQDAEILNFALLLEHVQAGLYADAIRRKALKGELLEFAEIVGAHERAHIAFIREALGGKARKPPKLDFGDDTATAEAFTDVALKLEDLGVAAYNAQAPNLTKDALRAAARIVSVEARHASWIRAIKGVTPAPDASEPPAPAERVVATLNGSGYVE
ncbi:MAG TPA: ferritin-like domain-containing protein [Solirubrobacteraceae bacterium]|nr:ferritin-like domain-containing protein [Solirubrobacteraceae bacterium]